MRSYTSHNAAYIVELCEACRIFTFLKSGSYLAENTLRFYYKDQPVNVYGGKLLFILMITRNP